MPGGQTQSRGWKWIHYHLEDFRCYQGQPVVIVTMYQSCLKFVWTCVSSKILWHELWWIMPHSSFYGNTYRLLLASGGLQNHPREYLCEEQIEVEFGGLEWEWHPIQANEKYLKWIEDNVVVRPHARHLESPNLCIYLDFFGRYRGFLWGISPPQLPPMS